MLRPAKQRPPVECLLFDLDGTLIDSIDLIRASYAHALGAHGISFDERGFLAGLGRPLRWQFSQLKSSASEVEAMIATYRSFNSVHHDDMVRVFPGVLDSLERLRSRGTKLGIVTSKLRQGADHGLLHCGFELEWFGAIVAADDVAEHKPDPAPVRRALELLGVAPECAVMVGDSPHDLASGRKAGTATAAVAWGPFPHAELFATSPDHWLETPGQIANLAS